MRNGTRHPPHVLVEIRRHSKDLPWTYNDLEKRQYEIAARVGQGGQGGLLVSELAPVITYGRRTPREDILTNPYDLTRLGIGLQATERGGLATYHGPGQWVLFPVDNLETLAGDPRGVKKVIMGLLEIALAAGEIFDPTAHIRLGAELGVWTSIGKFASVGVQVDRQVLHYGLSVNGYKTPISFMGLRPCGLNLPMDFLLKQPTEDQFLDLGKFLIQRFLKRFWPRARQSLVDEKGKQGYIGPQMH